MSSTGKSRNRVALLDYGSGNLRSAQRALERVGAEVEITSEPSVAVAADGLVVPGVGAFAACMEGLRSVRGPRIIGERLAGGRPVLGICVGLQVLFDRGVEFADGEHVVAEACGTSGTVTDRGTEVSAEVVEAELEGTPGCGEWPGTVARLDAPVLPHMGWDTVRSPEGSTLFAGIDPDDRFYFVHSFGVRDWVMPPSPVLAPPLVGWCDYGGGFVASVENGPLCATQFHPEKSGDAGARLLENWVTSL